MARYTEAVCKLCRREGQKLVLKGERCYTDKCAISRRAYAPGQHRIKDKPAKTLHPFFYALYFFQAVNHIIQHQKNAEHKR